MTSPEKRGAIEGATRRTKEAVRVFIEAMLAVGILTIFGKSGEKRLRQLKVVFSGKE